MRAECYLPDHVARDLPAGSRFKPDRSSMASLATNGGLWKMWRGELPVMLDVPPGLPLDLRCPGAERNRFSSW